MYWLDLLSGLFLLFFLFVIVAHPVIEEIKLFYLLRKKILLEELAHQTW